MTTATATAEHAGLRLHRLEAENFLRLKALTIDADGRHVLISGPNGAGKTSAVEAIWTALKGASTKDLPEPIHKGAARASVRLDLGAYAVERRWTEKATTLIVTAADGSRVAKPQQLLDGLLSTYALDPVAFLQRRPQDQVDDVLAIAGVAPPAERVAEVTGERHAPRPGESADGYLQRLSGDEQGVYYVRRREAHRTAEGKRAALEEQRRVVEQLGGPLKPDEQQASASSLLEQVAALQQKADERRALADEAAQARAAHERAAARLAQLEADRKREAQAVEDLGRQILELQRRQQAHRDAAAELSGRIAKGTEVVAGLSADACAAEAAAAALPDPAPRVAELRRQVQTVEQSNAQRSKRAHAGEQLDRLARELEHAQGEHRRLDQVLAELRELRAHLLDGCDLGVPGLEVGQGELRLNGVSFRQASQAEQLRVACAVAMRGNPRLKLLRIDDGEHLDRASRETLLRMADEHGWQVVMTCVRDTEKLQVEIVEGN